MDTAADARRRLETAFGQRLGIFYRALSITPPYHSVEKAKLLLRERLTPLTVPDLQGLLADDAAMSGLFGQIVGDSGLAKKHRGIVQALLAADPDRIPPECRALGDAYRR
jgi:hypothetical protein